MQRFTPSRLVMAADLSAIHICDKTPSIPSQLREEVQIANDLSGLGLEMD